MEIQLQAGEDKIVTSKNDVWKKIIITILLIAAVGSALSRFPSNDGIGWYHSLKQPFFAPAYWMPFVIWPIVYILMGSAAGIIWHIHSKTHNAIVKKKAKISLWIFAVHLVFNLLCPILLISLEAPKIALIDILILNIFIAILIFQFKKINQTASRLLIPYFIWIIYATALNIAIVALN